MMPNRLITLQGPSRQSEINLSDFDNVGAGIAYLALVAKRYPNFSFRDLMELRSKKAPEGMGTKWYEKVYEGIGDFTDSVGDNISDALDLMGRKGGEIVRLLADEDVKKLVTDGAALYATGGASAGANPFMDFLSNLGKTVKGGGNDAAGNSGAFPKWALPVAFGGLGLFLLLAMVGRK